MELMQETVERSIESEEKKGGLVIRKALYGKLHGDDLRWVGSASVCEYMYCSVA